METVPFSWSIGPGSLRLLIYGPADGLPPEGAWSGLIDGRSGPHYAPPVLDPNALSRQVVAARRRSLDLLGDLDDDQLRVPLLPTVNPMLWELGHLVYFQELWVLREAGGREPLIPEVDALFDSISIGHEDRWRLPVPPREVVESYARDVMEAVLELLEAEPDPRLLYLAAWSVAHEDMHGEALTYTRQALGYPAPRHASGRPPEAGDAPSPGDTEVPGGRFHLGAPRGVDFCHDNEKWAHPVEVRPFRMARTCVTDGDMAAFVHDGGYERRELWTAEGWRWRQAVQAELPLYWRRAENGFQRRRFDRWVPLDPGCAAVHVSCYEAQAYCRWQGRRLPTEAEWELAASLDPAGGRRTHPWGEDAPGPGLAHVDALTPGPAGSAALPAGESPWGCRQMLGNVWEWTSSVFGPYPGFEPDMYADYSRTSFGTRRVLRGGSWVSPGRMLRNTWRNFFQPCRRDVFAGFRTCAGDD